MAEIRHDPLEDRWVLLAPERSRRPLPGKIVRAPAKAGTPCPFCPGEEASVEPALLEWPDAPADWQLRVCPNRYPLLSAGVVSVRRGEGVYDVQSGVGAHEIVIESREHSVEFPDLPLPHATAILRAYRTRVADLYRDVRLRQVIFFKNRGWLSGATLEHGHSQLVATPFLPPASAARLRTSRDHFARKERCLLQDLVDQEVAAGRRMVREADGVATLVPFAAATPFEMLVVSLRPTPPFGELDDAGCAALASALQDAQRRLRAVLDDPDFNLVLYCEPNFPHLPAGTWDATPRHAFRWHVRLAPRQVPWAGFEWSSGTLVNTVNPDEAARLLRAAL